MMARIPLTRTGEDGGETCRDRTALLRQLPALERQVRELSGFRCHRRMRCHDVAKRQRRIVPHSHLGHALCFAERGHARRIAGTRLVEPPRCGRGQGHLRVDKPHPESRGRAIASCRVGRLDDAAVVRESAPVMTALSVGLGAPEFVARDGFPKRRFAPTGRVRTEVDQLFVDADGAVVVALIEEPAREPLRVVSRRVLRRPRNPGRYQEEREQG